MLWLIVVNTLVMVTTKTGDKMSLVEIIDEQDRVQRIDFWSDNEVQVLRSHSMSYLAERKLYQSMGEFMALDVKSCLYDGEQRIREYHE